MWAATTVGVHDDNFATGKAGIRGRSTENKATRVVDEDRVFLGEPSLAKYWLDDVPENILAKLVETHIRSVLRCDNDCIDCNSSRPT